MNMMLVNGREDLLLKELLLGQKIDVYRVEFYIDGVSNINFVVCVLVWSLLCIRDSYMI